jgi:hypothetical protein
MGYSAEMTLGKRLAYGDNVEKALTLLQVVQTAALSGVFGESHDAKRETKVELCAPKVGLTRAGDYSN